MRGKRCERGGQERGERGREEKEKGEERERGGGGGRIRKKG